MKVILTLLVVLAACSLPAQKRYKVLVFSKTAGYYHESIPAGIKAITKIGAENNFDVDTTTDASKFTDANLKQYQLIIFLSTTGKLFDTLQKQAFQRYVRNGGGVAGVHASTDAEYNWPWYGKLMGGYFESHPKQQTAKLLTTVSGHPATKGLPGIWTRYDEWYNYKDLNNDVHVLLTLDERSYTGGKHGQFHPISWWHDFDGGRVFYTGLGHTDSSYIEPLFLKHLTGGIMFVLNRDKLPQAKAPTSFDAQSGFDKFLLGARQTGFDTTVVKKARGGNLTWKGKTEIIYYNPTLFDEPVLIGGVPFNNVFLTFDSATNSLMRITLMKTYRMYWDRDYKTFGQESFNKLVNYLETQLGRKGKKKKFANYKTVTESGFEWTNNTTKTQASLYEDKGERHPMVDIRLTFEMKE